MGYQSVEIRARVHTNHGMSDGLRGVSLYPSDSLANPEVSVIQGLGSVVKTQTLIDLWIEVLI